MRGGIYPRVKGVFVRVRSVFGRAAEKNKPAQFFHPHAETDGSQPLGGLSHRRFGPRQAQTSPR